MELTLKELIKHHRNQAQMVKAIAVGWGGTPGSFDERENYRFHCDAAETLEKLSKASNPVATLQPTPSEWRYFTGTDELVQEGDECKHRDSLSFEKAWGSIGYKASELFLFEFRTKRPLPEPSRDQVGTKSDDTVKRLRDEANTCHRHYRDEASKAQKCKQAYIEQEKEVARLRDENAKLRAAAKAVVARWETPLWKDAEPTASVIYRLRNALAAAPEEPLTKKHCSVCVPEEQCWECAPSVYEN